ncbi:hypothetical protein FHW96_002607 [Novosphingobium sp. SG751A]|uniref:hypothetical protein n=1 Tax=Novosphingobium sp. SG751A TaxID=2587000 RepID=UPI001554A133|nr:hypothetical protein [Novosphingobium sp. SG751A]NOW46447.1 hypothetical protein [Novosphingobium sp. SG751A]
MHRIDCTTDQARAPARFEQTARPATAPRHAEAQTCPVSEQSVNGWMMVILIAGAIIIGVPAARSRNRHVVFS